MQLTVFIVPDKQEQHIKAFMLVYRNMKKVEKNQFAEKRTRTKIFW